MGNKKGTSSRAFARDAYMGMRLPLATKQRLIEKARRQQRDTSNLALNLINKGLDGLDEEERRQLAASFAALQRG